MSAFRAWLLCLACALPGMAGADVFRPAYLEMRDVGDGRYDILWKVPARHESVRLALQVRFPPDTETTSATRAAFTGNAIVERWRIRRSGGLTGQEISIEGQASGISDIIVRVEQIDGTSQVERLSAARPRFTVSGPASVSQIGISYLWLGIEHILGGIDHLAFVLALLLIVRGTRRVVLTITAFTAAHSITLAAATLGWLRIPGPPVEAIIALSIVFVAAEAVHAMRGRTGLTARVPWVVAFSFGLLHGLGFAGALAEVGLPQKAIPLALLTFNVGVELGQLLFVATAILGLALVRRAAPRLPAWMSYAVPYAIGAVATSWTLERVVSFWN